MKRVNLFLIVLIASIAALIASIAIGFAVFSQTQNPTNWMSQMWSGSGNNNGYTGGMGGMMGGQTGAVAQSTTNSWLSYFGILFAILISVTIVALIGIGYYLLYPQIRMGAVQPQATLSQITTNNGVNAYDSVSKTLTDEERKIIEVLNQHNGKYLQKYIRNETGLSRLKTHRIIARLADRGIVSLEKTGNTNQVYLASWLTQKA